MTNEVPSHHPRSEQRLCATEERFELAQAAGGIGLFEWDLTTNEWEWTRHLAVLFGFDPNAASESFADWRRAIFIDDVPKLRGAADLAAETGEYYVEFRVRHTDGSVHWIAAKGEARKDARGEPRWISGVCYDISQRKQLEAPYSRPTRPWSAASLKSAKKHARLRF
jgi:PAS domain S-box-containing protein